MQKFAKKCISSLFEKCAKSYKICKYFFPEIKIELLFSIFDDYTNFDITNMCTKVEPKTIFGF